MFVALHNILLSANIYKEFKKAIGTPLPVVQPLHAEDSSNASSSDKTKLEPITHAVLCCKRKHSLFHCQLQPT